MSDPIGLTPEPFACDLSDSDLDFLLKLALKGEFRSGFVLELQREKELRDAFNV